MLRYLALASLALQVALSMKIESLEGKPNQDGLALAQSLATEKSLATKVSYETAKAIVDDVDRNGDKMMSWNEYKNAIGKDAKKYCAENYRSWSE